MPLVVNGTAAQRAQIESWLREICFRATVDPATGSVSSAPGPSAPGQFESGCACIEQLINGARTVTIKPLAGPAVPVPGWGGATIADGGGGATVPSGAGGVRQGDGTPGNGPDGNPGTNVDVYVDVSNNGGAGYPHGSPMWLVLAHELTSGHAYHLSMGTSFPPGADAEGQAIGSENEHRREHGMDPRPMPGTEAPPPEEDGGGDGDEGGGGTGGGSGKGGIW